MNFSQLPSNNEPTRDTVRHEFLQLEGAPWVEVRPASRENKEYFNALLKAMTKLRMQMEKGTMTVEIMERQDVMIRELFAKHVVAKIGGWVDEDGEAIPSNAESIAALCKALPEALFSEIAEVANDEDSFRGL